MRNLEVINVPLWVHKRLLMLLPHPGFLSRDKTSLVQGIADVQLNEPVESAKIEEIIEDKVPDSPISTH